MPNTMAVNGVASGAYISARVENVRGAACDAVLISRLETRLPIFSRRGIAIPTIGGFIENGFSV